MSKATITFLKSGEYPASDQTTVIAPPPLSEEERQRAKRLLVRRLCLVAVATGVAVAGVVVKRSVGGGEGRK